ncbi:unnamed protein product, partial [Polarella glacialis]
LPPEAGGSQALASAVLPHFPRLSEALAGVLTRLLCRWSEAGAAGDSAAKGEVAPHLGPDCCELLLEALLRGRKAQSDELLAVRLRAASAVLRVLPRSAPSSTERAVRGEQSALRMADAIAGWLMDEVGPDASAASEASNK